MGQKLTKNRHSKAVIFPHLLIQYFSLVGSYKRAHGQYNTSVLEFSHYYYGCGRRFKNLHDFLNAVIYIYKVPLRPGYHYVPTYTIDLTYPGAIPTATWPSPPRASAGGTRSSGSKTGNGRSRTCGLGTERGSTDNGSTAAPRSATTTRFASPISWRCSRTPEMKQREKLLRGRKGIGHHRFLC